MPIPVYDLTNTGIQFGLYRYTIWPVPVYNFRYIFKDLGRFQFKIEDSKNMCLNMGSRIIKIQRVVRKTKELWNSFQSKTLVYYLTNQFNQLS